MRVATSSPRGCAGLRRLNLCGSDRGADPAARTGYAGVMDPEGSGVVVQDLGEQADQLVALGW
jgi:hypothetical protein